MAVPDRIEIDLARLQSAENLDRVAGIARLARQILFSEEVSPSADETGEWPQDWDWNLESGRIALARIGLHERAMPSVGHGPRKVRHKG